MKNETTLSDLIFLTKMTDSSFITKWLENIEDIIKKTPNDTELGAKIRKYL